MGRIIHAFIAVFLWSIPARADTWALEGTVLTPESVIQDGVVAVSGDRISSVGTNPGEENVSPLRVPGIILPGFIDLHNHLTWNIFPRWRPCRKFSNRYEWQETSEYDRLMKTPEAKLVADGLGCEADLFAEVKAITGGATSVVGSFAGRQDHPGENACIAGLARNLDFASGLPADPVGAIAYEVFPFEVAHDKLDLYRNRLAAGDLKCLLIHLSEGSPGDASAHREFKILKAEDLLRRGVVLIHGVALTQDDFQAMKPGMGLVWSPRSNDELYGGTANIPAAQRAGVTVALAPDWSPTGSAGMLEELNYASVKYKFFDAKQLVEMTTTVPARLAGIDVNVGSLKAGNYADILVLRAGTGSAYESVVNSTPADVLLVAVGGTPVYGEPTLMSKLLPGRKLDPVQICGTTKSLNLTGSGAAQLKESWDDIQNRLSSELQRSGIRLASFECN
jgi:5-methylthioadenosine/S-adenosylhomocysteine deaminase